MAEETEGTERAQRAAVPGFVLPAATRHLSSSLVSSSGFFRNWKSRVKGRFQENQSILLASLNSYASTALRRQCII